MISLREREFVEAAIGLGASTWRLLWSDILPNVVTTVIVFFPLMIAIAMLTEAALSFLSIGVQPPNASWGTIILDGQGLLYTRPAVALAPGIAIAVTVLALNVLGDGVRDALDPRAKLRSARLMLRFVAAPARLDGASCCSRSACSSFLIFFATPGVDPAARIAGRNADQATLARGAARTSGSTGRCRCSTR